MTSDPIGYAYDFRGNVTGIYNVAGTRIAAYEYDEFGNQVSSGSAQIQPFGFSTKRYDEQLGLVYFGYRFYDPKNGVWITSDPIGLAGGINTYAYVEGNPVSFIDPTGLAYSPSGEHGLSRSEVGLGSGNPDCGCIEKILGLDTAIGAGLVAGGQPSFTKPFTQQGTSSGTSPISTLGQIQTYQNGSLVSTTRILSNILSDVTCQVIGSVYFFATEQAHPKHALKRKAKNQENSAASGDTKPIARDGCKETCYYYHHSIQDAH